MRWLAILPYFCLHVHYHLYRRILSARKAASFYAYKAATGYSGRYIDHSEKMGDDAWPFLL